MVIFHSYVKLPEGTLWEFVSVCELEAMAHRKFIGLPMKDGDFPVRKLLVYQRVFVHESFGRVNPPSL